jgi:hypothetical protein
LSSAPYPATLAGSFSERLRARRDALSPLPLRWQLALAFLVLAVLMSPMVFSGSTFGGDWPTHLWLVQMQARNIEALGHPSLFFQSSLGAFEAWYAFYGGTLYSIAAAGAVISGGHTLAVYILSWALAMAMAWGGFTWLSRQAGLRGWTAHIAGLVFVSSAYYLTDVYARGAWAETVATSSIPLLLAAGLSLLRAEAWRAGPVLAFVVGVVLFTGSHNITLLYGTIFLALLCVTGALAVGRDALPARRRVLGVAALGLLATGVNLWFLLPDVAFQGHTSISHSFTKAPTLAGGTPPSLVLDPIRHSQVENFPTLDIQVPMLALLWALAALALCWRSLAVLWRRLTVALSVTCLPFLALLLDHSLWHDVPKILWSIQFPYRLLSYIDYCFAGLVMVALVALTGQRRGELRRRATTALVLVGIVFAAIEGVQAVHQEWSGPSSLHSRSEIFPGGSKLPGYWIRFVSYLQYQDVSLPVRSASISEIPGLTVYNGEGANVIPVPVTPTPKSGYSVEFTIPKSGTINTNVISGPYLVAVHGAKFVGRTPYSELLISVKKNPKGPNRVTFGTATTWPIVVGKWATILCVLILAGLLVLITVHRRGGRSAAWPRRRPAS